MTNGHIYIGRRAGKMKMLYGRLQDYFQTAYLHHPRNRSSLICKALIKHGMSSFALLILEYVDSAESSVRREQYYLNTLDTPYNIQKTSGHPRQPAGYTHSAERKEVS